MFVRVHISSSAFILLAASRRILVNRWKAATRSLNYQSGVCRTRCPCFTSSTEIAVVLHSALAMISKKLSPWYFVRRRSMTHSSCRVVVTDTEALRMCHATWHYNRRQEITDIIADSRYNGASRLSLLYTCSYIRRNSYVTYQIYQSSRRENVENEIMMESRWWVISWGYSRLQQVQSIGSLWGASSVTRILASIRTSLDFRTVVRAPMCASISSRYVVFTFTLFI